MLDSWFIKKNYELSTRHFHKWYGLASALLLLIIVSLFVYRLIPAGEFPFIIYGIIITILGATILIGWAIHVWKYPKRSRTRLGVSVAVQVEDLEIYKFFQKDFLTPFKSKIRELGLPFDVLVLKNHQSEKVETVVDARRVLKNTRAHFCIWGSIKKRKNAPDGEKYLFSLRGIVIHRPIQEVQKVLLRKEFDALLPNTLVFEEHLQFEIFEFRANQAVTALHYITGRAALLSGDFNIAIRLHESLFNAIQSGQQYPISKEILKGLLSLEYEQKANFEFFNRATGNAYIESVKKSLQYNQHNYGALLKRAIVEFDGGNGNPQTALNTIKEAKQRAPNSVYHWLYSKAFLHFWMGQYNDAIQSCEKLQKKSYDGEEITVQEVIRFNEDLVKEFDKPQLCYWLGFVSIVKSRNISLAYKYFQTFVEKADNSMNDLKIRAESYLSNIQKEIGY